MLIKSTVDNPFKWRIWHFINYIIGGITFFFGSLVLYPYFATKFDNALISGWLYTVGSACFLLADITEWTHYERAVVCDTNAKCCEHRSLSLNFIFSACGSGIYLIGSIMFIPAINQPVNGLYTFIVGSSCIALSQLLKILRVACQKNEKGCCKNLMQDKSGFFVDLFAGLGGLMYLIGSIIFFDADQAMIATTIFVAGGTFFYLSGLFMLKRYFCQIKLLKQDYQEGNTSERIDETVESSDTITDK